MWPRGFVPTTEQERVADAKDSGRHICLQAAAGTGKTSTLAGLSTADTRRTIYLAYNRPIVDEAARKFPSRVTCLTGHSLALRSEREKYAARLNAYRREHAWKVGLRLGIPESMRERLGLRLITFKTLSYSAIETVKKFCHSADDELGWWHVPRLKGLDDEYRRELAHMVVPFARKAWRDLQNPDQGVVPFLHDHYQKIWALTEPTIPADLLLLDEAQDTNPVLEKVFKAQRSHAQLIMVGDSAQAIYGWRGARDVMSEFEGAQLQLTQSFRFGPALAEQANLWLDIAEAPLRLRGTPTIDTTIGPVENADAVLCRSNAGAIAEVMRLMGQNKRVAIVGKPETLERLAIAARELKAGRRTGHPELMLFRSWDELVEYATSDPSGGDLLPLVNIIDSYGPDDVIKALRMLYPERDAEVTVSTAHKAKGREWPTVRIAHDFMPRQNQAAARGVSSDDDAWPAVDLDEARLAYVAVTRARRHLDLGGLSWITEFSKPSVSESPEV